MNASRRSRAIAHIRAQWAGFLALFLVIAGGTAYAANTVGSEDVIDNSLRSVDLHNNQVLAPDVRDEVLTGLDVKDQSGVDTCTHGTARYGELCVLATNGSGNWQGANDACKALELRVPSLGEAQAVASHHTIPNLGASDVFWTEEFYTEVNPPNPPDFRVWTVTGSGNRSNASFMSSAETVCVTTPTN